MSTRSYYLTFTLRAIAAAGWLLAAPALAQKPEPWPVPQFRYADITAAAPRLVGPSPIRLLADEDFPPFSFRREDGVLAGLSVDLARAVCAELRSTCEIVPRPWGELVAALEAGQGDAIISGVRVTPRLLESVEATRPYYWALARIAMRAGETSRLPNIGALKDIRVGAIKGSAHAAYLAQHFPDAAIKLFVNGQDAQEGLRTGEVDALFADAIRLIFWTRGKSSRSCCVLTAGAYFDPATFSHGLSFVVRRGRGDLRAAFDYALDRAQTRGTFAEIMQRYVPESPW
jgi:polar amino acid transport system substrate-binding protein